MAIRKVNYPNFSKKKLKLNQKIRLSHYGVNTYESNTGKDPVVRGLKFQTLSFGRGSNFEFAIDPKK